MFNSFAVYGVLLLLAVAVNAQLCSNVVNPPPVTLMSSSTVAVVPVNASLNALGLRLRFRGDQAYSNTTFSFVGASTACNSDIPTTVGYWNVTNYAGAFVNTADYGTGQYVFNSAITTVVFATPLNNVVSFYTSIRNSAGISGDWYQFFSSNGTVLAELSFNPRDGQTITRTFTFGTILNDLKTVNIHSWWNPSYLNDFWVTYVTSVNCSSEYTYTAAINDALASCNFGRMEGLKNSNTTTYRSTVLITTTQSRGSIRGLPMTSVRQTSVQVDIDFGTYMETSSGPLTVFGSRITFGRVVSQSFNPATLQATLQILTSVQSPYQLRTPVLAAVSGFTTTVAPTVAESGQPTIAVCNGTSPCTQYWTVTVARSNPCNPSPSTLTNAGWSLTFTVGCHSSFSGSCSTPAPDNDGVSFDTTSDNFCPVLVDTVASSATLNVFSDAALTVPQTIFVFGARSYFRAVVNSPIALAAMRVERVTLSGSTPAGVSVLYSSTFNNAAAYFGTAPVVTYGNHPAGFTGTFAAFPSFMLVSENIAGATSLQRVANFSWIWSGATSSANTDASVSMIVRVDLRVRYANQSTVSKDHLITMEAKLPNSASRRTLDDDNNEVAGISSSVGVAVQAIADGAVSGGDNSQDTSSGSSASTSSVPVFSVAVAAIGCAIALFAAVAVTGLVRKMRVMDQRKDTFSGSPSSGELNQMA